MPLKGTFLETWLLGFLSPGLTDFLLNLVMAVIVALVATLPIVVLTWMERKVVARIQDRIGPNLAGPYGVLQAIADAIKMFTKEDTMPAEADRVVYNIAPIAMAAAAMMTYAVFPWSPGVVGADLNIGVLYFLAMGAATTVVVLMAGWGSNNKYALLGAFRAVAQLISYEIPQVLALMVPIMFAGTMSTVGIVQKQEVIYALLFPVSFLAFLIAGIAETGRSPFDLLEAESEIVAGYHTEYSGMKFALFFLAEYAAAFGIAVITTVVFLGGWRFFGLETRLPFLAPIILVLKALLIVFVLMWIRGTLPRFRIDHLLAFNWKFLVPLTLINIVVVAIVGKVVSGAPFGVQAVVLLASNLVLLFGALAVLGAAGRRARRQWEERIASIGGVSS
ncbi:MAG TPA: NADH-quinone oxidoreductase subunit NuoH [Chloroflexi bacterium]|nr:NADH-quinone oxidoreductase subunit NuoH [Chloroflexota bacterium]